MPFAQLEIAGHMDSSGLHDKSAQRMGLSGGQRRCFGHERMSEWQDPSEHLIGKSGGHKVSWRKYGHSAKELWHEPSQHLIISVGHWLTDSQAALDLAQLPDGQRVKPTGHS
jgi:hypothetical protein